MSRFLGPLDLRQAGRSRWWLLAPLAYESDLLGRAITVPAEFVTDLASVPRLPLAYMLTGDRARGPAVVHDYLYQRPDRWDRAFADAIFREAMAVHQPETGFEAEGPVIRALMYAGVRAGGWKAWRDHRTRQAQLNPIWTREGWPA